MKNFIAPKTGHAASDEWFKNQPIWFDIDMLRSFLLGIFLGAFIATIVIMCL